MNRENEWVLRLKEVLNELSIIASNSATLWVRKASWNAFSEIQKQAKESGCRGQDLNWFYGYDDIEKELDLLDESRSEESSEGLSGGETLGDIIRQKWLYDAPYGVLHEEKVKG